MLHFSFIFMRFFFKIQFLFHLNSFSEWLESKKFSTSHLFLCVFFIFLFVFICSKFFFDFIFYFLLLIFIQKKMKWNEMKWNKEKGGKKEGRQASRQATRQMGRRKGRRTSGQAGSGMEIVRLLERWGGKKKKTGWERFLKWT
jgi:hypothetical protein